MNWGACPACGGRLEPWRRVPSSEPALQATFQLLRCAGCGSAVTADKAPVDLHETGAYGSAAPRLSNIALPLLRSFDAHRLALLRTLIKPPARLLDVGSGRGRFVQSARRAGYDALGLEPSPRGARAAAAIGAPVRGERVEQADFGPESFDAATVWHVLEHLDDPAGPLTRIGWWLRPGGALLLGVPNLASLQARIGGEHWFHLDVPRHRIHFTAKGVDRLLRRTGFRPIATHHILLEHNTFGMWQSLVNRLTSNPSYLYNLLKRNAGAGSPDLAITLAALPFAPLAALAELLAGFMRRGGTIAVLARRGP